MNKKTSKSKDFFKCIAFPVPTYNNIDIINPSCKKIVTHNYCGEFCINPTEEQDIEIWKTNTYACLVGITVINETQEKIIIHIVSNQLETMIVLPQQTSTFTGINVKTIKIINTNDNLNNLEGKYFIQATFQC